MCNSLWDDGKEEEKRWSKKERRTNVYRICIKKVFLIISKCVVFVDPCMLTAPVFRLNEEAFKVTIQEGPTQICDICRKF